MAPARPLCEVSRMSLHARFALRELSASGPTLVFLHGYGCDQQMWRRVWPAFTKTHRVVVYDHMGSGASDLSCYRPERYRTLHGYADDLAEICESLAAEEISVVGHSVGATIALLGALRTPRIARLALVCPSPCYRNDGAYRGGFEPEDLARLIEALAVDQYGWARNFAPIIMGLPLEDRFTQELRDSFCRGDPRIAREFAEATFLSDHRDALDRCDRPTLVLQASDDSIAPAAVGAYVAERLPKGELVRLHARGHCPHVSAPDEVAAALTAFLSAAAPA
jgi:sigma-B regulation protein RsbQ